MHVTWLLDKHINDGFGDQDAIIYDSPVTETVKKLTYKEVRNKVARLAGGLKAMGLKKEIPPLFICP